MNRQELTEKEPEKGLILFKKKTGGRNSQGKITVRHRGGGARRYLRIIDFKRDKYDMPAKVVALEYDPGRTANIVLLEYEDKEKRYMLAPLGMKIGDTVVSSLKKAPVKNGNRMPLINIPVGETVHDVEITPGGGGKIVRSAGMGAMLLATENGFAQLKMPSSEIRLVPAGCSATIGTVGNPEAGLVRWGKAGRLRHLGWKPSVRGKAMNPVDHPHGGGEGHNPIGMKFPKTKWGKHAFGVKTRGKNRASDKLILQRRKK